MRRSDKTARERQSATTALDELAEKIPMRLFACTNLPARNAMSFCTDLLNITSRLTVTFAGWEEGKATREYRINDDPRVFKTLPALLSATPEIASTAAKRYAPGYEKKFKAVNQPTKGNRE